MIRILENWLPARLQPMALGLALCLLAPGAQAREPVAPAFMHVMCGYMALENVDPLEQLHE